MSTTEPPPNRPPRETPHLHLPVPGDAEPADAPTDIGKLADALDGIASSGYLGVDTGDVKMSARETPPDGWLLCDGRAVSREVFADLFDAIGVRFGAGDGAVTFNIPDYRNAFPRGAASAGTTGARGGAASAAIAVAHLPAHSHSCGDDWPDHAHAINGGTGNDGPDHAHGIGDPGHSHWMGAVDRWSNASFLTQVGTPGPRFTSPGAGGSGTDAAGTGIWIGGATARHTHGISFWSGGVSARHSHGIGNTGGGAAFPTLPPYAAVNFFIKT